MSGRVEEIQPERSSGDVRAARVQRRDAREDKRQPLAMLPHCHRKFPPKFCLVSTISTLEYSMCLSLFSDESSILIGDLHVLGTYEFDEQGCVLLLVVSRRGRIIDQLHLGSVVLHKGGRILRS